MLPWQTTFSPLPSSKSAPSTGSAQSSRGAYAKTAADLRADANAMRAELGLERVDERERDQRGRFTGDMNARIRQAAGR